MAKRQVLLVAGTGDEASSGDLAPPVGTVREVLAHFGRFNTAPDKERGTPGGGIALLHGPGMLVEVPTFSDDVVQVMVTMTDQDYAFPVLVRVCRAAGWRMVDPESGRTFG